MNFFGEKLTKCLQFLKTARRASARAARKSDPVGSPSILGASPRVLSELLEPYANARCSVEVIIDPPSVPLAIIRESLNYVSHIITSLSFSVYIISHFQLFVNRFLKIFLGENTVKRGSRVCYPTSYPIGRAVYALTVKCYNQKRNHKSNYKDYNHSHEYSLTIPIEPIFYFFKPLFHFIYLSLSF